MRQWTDVLLGVLIGLLAVGWLQSERFHFEMMRQVDAFVRQVTEQAGLDRDALVIGVPNRAERGAAMAQAVTDHLRRAAAKR